MKIPPVGDQDRTSAQALDMIQRALAVEYGHVQGLQFSRIDSGNGGHAFFALELPNGQIFKISAEEDLS